MIFDQILFDSIGSTLSSLQGTSVLARDTLRNPEMQGAWL